MNPTDPVVDRCDLLLARSTAQRHALAEDLQQLSARTSGLAGWVSGVRGAPARSAFALARRHPWIVATAAQAITVTWRSRPARWATLAAVAGAAWLARSRRAERDSES